MLCSQAQLKKTEVEVQQMIHDRLKKMDEIQQSVELSKVKWGYGTLDKCVHLKFTLKSKEKVLLSDGFKL